MLHWWMDRQTDRQTVWQTDNNDFIGPSVGQGPKKELEHAIYVDISYLAAKSGFIALKAEVDKLDINKFINVPNDLNDLKTKIDDLDVGIVHIDLKKLSNVVNKEVVKKTVYNKLNSKVNNLENEIL